MAALRKIVAILLVMVMAVGLMPAMAEETLDIDTELLVLANSAAPLTSAYEPLDLVKLVSRRNDVSGRNANDGVYTVSSSSIQLRAEAAEALARLCNDAENAGMILYVRQGYRSYADEAARYARMEKRGEAGQKPGENDYQTGLAVTLVSKDWRAKTLTADFGQTKEAQWLASNSARYGFVLRYPQGKQDATGWEWEPWHLRYVGKTVAEIMQLNNLCLEEFCQQMGLDGVIDMPEPVATAEPTKKDTTLHLAADEVPFKVPEYLPDGALILDEQGPDGDYEITLFHD